MFKFLGAGLLETEHFATFRVNAGHNVPNSAVFAGAIHPLEDQQ